MSRRLALLLLTSLSLLPPMGGCIAVGGSDRYTKPTLGRQLVDLQTARESGAINQQEYEQAKCNLLAKS